MLLWILLGCGPQDAFAPPAHVPATARVGDAARAAVTSLPAPSGVTTWARDTAVGDFDGDGAPEIAVSGLDAAGDGVIYVYRVQGGALVETQRLTPDPAGTAAHPEVTVWGGDGEHLAAADLNGDGYDDLAVVDVDVDGFLPTVPYTTRWSGRLLVRAGGPGGVGPGVAYSLYNQTEPMDLWAARDPLGDGADRVLLAGRGTAQHTIAANWLEMDALVGGEITADYDDIPGSTYQLLERPVDIDGDGQDEVALAVFTRLSTYDGWLPTLDKTAGWASASPFTSPFGWSLRADYLHPASVHPPTSLHGAADLNLDGVPDLVLRPNGQDRRVHVYAGLGGSAFETAPLTLDLEPSDVDAGVSLQPDDFDGDGVVDVLALTTAGAWTRLYRWSAAPDGPDPVPTEVLDLFAQPAPTEAWSGDLDGDGDADLVLSRRGGYAQVVWGGPPEACPGGAAAVRAFPDGDADGFASSALAGLWCTPPAGSSPTPGADCDDDAPDVHPGSGVVIAGVDAGCDDLVTCYADADADGWQAAGPLQVPGYACSAGGRRLTGTPAAQVGDCDDAQRLTYPGASEASGADHSCDGVASCLTDNDGDGYGALPAVAVAVAPGATCPPGHPSVTLGYDCAPDDPAYHYAASWYIDGDADGAYVFASYGCLPPPGGVVSPAGARDCADADPARSPLLPELPGGADEDCDGLFACWADADRDGFGGPLSTADAYPSCAAFPAASDDCDDQNANISPARQDGLNTDNNCDGLVGCYPDADGDGFGAYSLGAAPSCPAPGFLVQSGDCADTDATRRPGRTEDPGTPFDDNCNSYTGITLRVEDRAWSVVDATPNTPLALAASRTRQNNGACPAALGGACLDLVRPIVFRQGRTNAVGAVSFPAYPDPIPGVRGWMQAVTLLDGPSALQPDVLRPGDLP